MPTRDRKPQQQNRVLAGLQETVADMISTLDLQVILQKAVERAAELVGADIVAIYIYDPLTGRIRAAAEHGVWDKGTFQQHELGRGKVALLVVNKGEPVIAGDISVSELKGPFSARERVKSTAGFPLKVGAEVIGVLFVNYRKMHKFEPEEIETLVSFGNLVAVAINAARLYEQVQARAETIHHLSGVGQSLTTLQESAKVLQETLERIANAAIQVLEADTVDLYQYRADIDDFLLPPIMVGERWFPSFMPMQVLPDDTVVKIAHTGEKIYASDAQSSPVFASEWEAPREWRPKERFVVREGIISAAAVPMKAGEEVLGVIFVSYRRRRDFDTDPELRERIETFANFAGVAIQNARLLQQERTLRQQAETLREVSAVISSRLELTEVAERILDELGKVIEYRKASMQLIRGDARMLIAYRGFGEEAVDRWLLRPISQDHLISRVVAGKKPLILCDPSKDPDWEVRPTTADIKSWVGLPLVYGEETIGLLTLDHDQAGFYTQAFEGLLVSFANQAAIAIENARLFGDAERRIRDMGIVNKVVEIIGTKLDTDDLLKTIVSQIADRLECTHCTIFFLQEEDGEPLLVPRVTYGERSEQIMTRRFKSGEGLAGLVFKEGKSLVLDDARKSPGFAPATDPQARPRSMLVAPLKIGDRTIGVISADQDEYGWFSESDRRLLDALALHVGIAIERATGLELLQDIGNRIISAPKVDDVLQEIVYGAIKLTHTTSGAIYLISEDGKSVISSFLYPPGFDHPPPRMDRGEGLTRQVIATGELMVFPDIRQDYCVNPGLHDLGIRSMIAIPLKLEQKVIGVLYLNDADFHDFHETEVSLLTTLTSQAAIAIQNARLYEDLQRRVKDLDTLNRVAGQVSTSLDRREILQTVVEAARTTLGANRCTLFTVDDNGVLVPQAIDGTPFDLANEPRFQLGEGLAGWVAQEGQSLLVPDTMEDSRFIPDERTRSDTLRSMVLAPLWVEGKVIGVISADQDRVAAFDENDRMFLETLAVQAGVAIHQESQRRQRVEAVRSRFNPYVVGEPIRDPEGFFGRRRYFQHIMDRIHGNNFIIYGERRIGKTSFLNQLKYHLETASKEDESYDFFLPVPASLQGISEDHFFSFLMTQIARAAMIPQDDLPVWKSKVDYHHYDFEDDLETVVRLLEERYLGKQIRIVLLLDEMDQFVNYNPVVHEQFRSLFATRYGAHLKMIMAGVSVQRVARARTSPWYNLFKEIELQPLDEAAARQLVVEPVLGYYTYENEALVAILDNSDLKPQEIQRLSSLAVDAMLDRVSAAASEKGREVAPEEVVILREDVLQATELALQEKSGEYRSLWRQLREDQRQALLDAVRGGVLVDTTATRSDGKPLFPPEDLYNITCRDDQEVRLIYLFREWLRRNYL